jgi:hypothetical protein
MVPRGAILSGVELSAAGVGGEPLQVSRDYRLRNYEGLTEVAFVVEKSTCC